MFEYQNWCVFYCFVHHCCLFVQCIVFWVIVSWCKLNELLSFCCLMYKCNILDQLPWVCNCLVYTLIVRYIVNLSSATCPLCTCKTLIIILECVLRCQYLFLSPHYVYYVLSHDAAFLYETCVIYNLTFYGWREVRNV